MMDRNVFGTSDADKSQKNNGALVPLTPVSIMPATQLNPHGLKGWLAIQLGRDTVQRAMEAATQEQCRALLTKVALENLGGLAALEDYLNQMYPNNAARNKIILDTFAVSSAHKIARWD